MAILCSAVNLRARVARTMEADRARVAADLRLIKVNKPFSLLLSSRLKAEIPRLINYPFAEREGEER